MPTGATRQQTTALLNRCQTELAASDELVPLLYTELRELAGGLLRRERGDHTLQPTALVHEAYVRLIDQASVQWEGRGHFLAIAATVMRRVLVDHARRRKADKRGDPAQRVTLDDGLVPGNDGQDEDVLVIEEALEKLQEVQPRAVKVAELRLFGGLTVAECAQHLEVSTTTVDDDWALARSWLSRALAG